MANGGFTVDETFMHRCIELAQLGAGNVAPNPMVGAVLVHEGRVIGEGYHRQYGQAHAEVNCIDSVAETDRQLIPRSTLYVSLEPCAHYGKTPPCADLIIARQIPKVVIGTRDPFKAVNGKGIEKLQQAGIEVVQHVLEQASGEVNRRFFIFHTQRRPYVVLKWAQTADKKIGTGTTERLMISKDITNRLVHRWRSEEAAILVGTNTALLDDPSLNVRLWHGKNPVRLVIDMDLRLPAHLKIFDGQQKTIIFNTVKHEEGENLSYYQVTHDVSLVHQVMNACYRLNIQSILVEGGAKLLQSFIDESCWDEARVITNTQLSIGDGLPAPVLAKAMQVSQSNITGDVITYFKKDEGIN